MIRKKKTINFFLTIKRVVLDAVYEIYKPSSTCICSLGQDVGNRSTTHKLLSRAPRPKVGAYEGTVAPAIGLS